MKTSLIVAAAGLMLGLAAPVPGPSAAWADDDSAEMEYKLELMKCKKIADPRQKEECVRNARSIHEKREPAESKTLLGTEKNKDAAVGGELLKKKSGKAK